MEWRAQPRQAAFLRADEDEVLYGGAAGGGKTDALLISCIRLCLRHAGANALFLRRTFADLSKPGAAIARSQELLAGRAAWNGQDHRWTFANGSRLQFGHVQHESDVYAYQGSQIDWLCWDELTQFTFDTYNYLRSRVRATVPGVRTGIRAATNPGGVGHGWVRARWIDAAAPGEQFVVEDGGRGVSARFVPARVADNPALLSRDPGYADRLASLGPALSRALLDGDWDQFEGQVFTEWRRDVHVVAPFAIPADWPRWHATDYGYRAPSCTLWGARAPDGRMYVYRERYETLVTADQQALTIRLWSAEEHIRAGLGDPSMWNRESTGRSVADQFAAQGVHLVPALNDRLAGLAQLHQLLAWRETERGSGEVVSPPALRVFATCANLIRTLPALVYDRVRVEDVDTDGEDHAYDALRYLSMAMARGRQLPAVGSYDLSGSNPAAHRRPETGSAWDPIGEWRRQVRR